MQGHTRIAQSSSYAIPNIFEAARGLSLTDDQIEGYIDHSLVGTDRALAHKIMKMMPPHQRGDFVYLALDGHLVSNNPLLLQYITVEHPDPISSTSSRAANATVNVQRARPMDYSNSCSPPNPPTDSSGQSTARGAYARQVSLCGFTAGWAFVNVPCGTSYFASGDAGFLYFEIFGRNKSLVEGGLQYNSDSSIQPYVSSTTAGFLATKMNNYAAKYGCGVDLGIMHGATYDGSMTYTEVGNLPASLTPETNFYNGNQFTLQNASWLFYQSPGDYTGVGTDPAGSHTPCTMCSITRLTTIGQNYFQSYGIDSSYFGVSGTHNAIHWMQVAFGEWESNCTPGTSLCTFDYSSDPLRSIRRTG